MYYRKDSLIYLILLKIRQFCKLIKLQTYLCTCMKFEIHPFIVMYTEALLGGCISCGRHFCTLSQKGERHGELKWYEVRPGNCT